MENDRLTVALVQMACSPDRAVNQRHIHEQLRAAAFQGARLVLLQELRNSLYFCQSEDSRHFDVAEPIPGPASDHLAALGKQLELVIVGSLAGTYRKMHIPDDPGYYEKFYFTPGDLGLQPIQTSVGKLGVLVCWDQWYPEAARLMALAGAGLLLYPTAIGWDPNDDKAEQQRQLDVWQTVQRAHAVANGIPVLACNRTGFEADSSGQIDGIQFRGNSFIAGCQGKVLATAAQDEAEWMIANIDKQRSEEVRRTWPYLRDRMIDAYDDLSLRFRDQ